MSLQYEFIKTKGASLSVGAYTVFQRDTISIRMGEMTVRFLRSCVKPMQGVQLSVKKGGSIELSDGTLAERLDIWRDPNFSDVVMHRIRTVDGLLYVHNRYMVQIAGYGSVPGNWTYNAGMTLLESGLGRKVYGCSDGIGDFAPEDLVFELLWKS